MTQIAPSVVPPHVRSVAPDTDADHEHQRRDDAAPRKRRDAHLDNAKFFGVILVVCGHVLEDLRDATGAHALYLFIYMFHMPLFIVLAGHFSRSFTFSAGKARKLITSLAVPYIIFEVAFAYYRWLLGVADKPTVSLLDPYFVTWFLIALFVWRLSTPVWQQLRWPIGVAVAISVLSGTAALPTTMDLYRMLGLLPFFVIGLMLKPEHFELLKRPMVRLAGALVLVGGLVVANIVHRRMTTEWALWRMGFDDLHVSNFTGSVMRLGMLLAGAILVAAFLAVVPGRHSWYTRLGGATMYAYLLHGFGTKLMEAKGWYDPAWLHTVPGVAVAMAAAAGFAVLLMTAPVRRVTRWAVSPAIAWIFTRPGTYAGTPRTGP
ncbi:MAG TPA: acyltransferase family protein [Streptosporangiaceae bacterium]|jgi:fucose 4-O-acetylase-like acetyltransferase|nr:acyltransferase family protein [Streptosporangiaceae bacterium]